MAPIWPNKWSLRAPIWGPRRPDPLWIPPGGGPRTPLGGTSGGYPGTLLGFRLGAIRGHLELLVLLFSLFFVVVVVLPST
eukprot:3353342-Pyramimonas_sp.AAC.1